MGDKVVLQLLKDIFESEFLNQEEKKQLLDYATNSDDSPTIVSEKLRKVLIAKVRSGLN